MDLKLIYHNLGLSFNLAAVMKTVQNWACYSVSRVGIKDFIWLLFYGIQFIYYFNLIVQKHSIVTTILS
jgi:hypothetical protein